MYKKKNQQNFIENGNKLKEDREKFKEAYKRMMVIMSCADIVGEFAPAGISEYIEFNAKFFKCAEVAIVIVERHAEIIAKTADRACKSAREKCYGRGSNLNPEKQFFEHQNMGK